ncbi:MAG TPA: hypothetical protein VEP89_10445, partial [Draconibacterium sp.]|nr:hypothetical protein [Draconibacterium sp.]
FIILFRLRLKTKITSKKISISFPPVIRKWRNIYPEDIKSYKIRHYYPRREFGGYGIKRRLRYGTAWIVAGETGLQLHLNNGKKFLIGTQKQNTLEQAMLKLMKGKE